jgi:hypothetical protein
METFSQPLPPKKTLLWLCFTEHPRRLRGQLLGLVLYSNRKLQDPSFKQSTASYPDCTLEPQSQGELETKAKPIT